MTNIPTTFELMRQAWNFIKPKAKVVYSVQFTAFIIIFALIVLLYFSSLAIINNSVNNTLAVLIVFLISTGCLIATIILGVWFQVALYRAIIEDIGFTTAFANNMQRIRPFFWTNAVTGLMIAVGFLLLIVPGVILAVWYIFVPFTVLSENLKGSAARARSKEYVKGKFGVVFGRLFISGLIYGVIYLVPYYFFSQTSIAVATVYAYLYAIVVTPFSIAYLYMLYKHLRPAPIAVSNHEQLS